MAQLGEHSPPTNVAQVRFLDLASFICGLRLLVLYSAPRGFLRVLRFPLSSKTNIWLIVLIVNFTLQCPQLVLQR